MPGRRTRTATVPLLICRGRWCRWRRWSGRTNVGEGSLVLGCEVETMAGAGVVRPQLICDSLKDLLLIVNAHASKGAGIPLQNPY